MFSSWWVILLAFVFPIPVGADYVVKRRPWATYALVAANIAVYLFTQPDNVASEVADGLFDRYGVIPASPHAVTLFTSLFVHMSFSHLVWNMLFLCVFGPLVEDAIGTGVFLILYFGGGITASLLHMAIARLWAPTSIVYLPLVGASGAISALLAPFAIRYYASNVRLFWLPGYLIDALRGCVNPAVSIDQGLGRLELPSIAFAGLFILQNLVGGIHGLFAPESGGIAYWAHIGGFVFGMVTAELTGLFKEGTREYLLQEARAAVARGIDGYTEAVEKYRKYLELNPHNAEARLELMTALAGMGKAELNKAVSGFLETVRDFYDKGEFTSAVTAAATARRLGVPIPLTARERLRLATVAQDAGDNPTAIALLEALTAETPDAAEDEIARLKLGQLLLTVDSARAIAILDGLTRKYPQSDWARLAGQLAAEARRNVADRE